MVVFLRTHALFYFLRGLELVLLFIVITPLPDSSVFGQERTPIEKQIPPALRKKPEVAGLLDRLHNLRKSDQRLGPKHPSKDKLRKEIDSLEAALIEYIAGVENSQGQTSKGDLGESQSPRIEQNDSALHGVSEGGKGVFGNQKEVDTLNTIVAIRSGSDAKTPYFQSDLLAYPWIDTRNLKGFGFFPGSEFVWGFENTGDGRGIVWKWVDNWFVKRKHLLADLPGEILCFLPSSRFQSDGLCFAVVKTEGDAENALFDLILGRVKASDLFSGEVLKVDSLVSYQASRNSRPYLEYLADTGDISIYPQSDISIRGIASGVPILRSDKSSVTFSTSKFLEQTGPKELKHEIKEFAFESSGNHHPCLTIPRRIESTKTVRPFWMKRGKIPSSVPSWYSQRYRTIEHWPSSVTDSVTSGRKLAIAVNALKPGERLLIHAGTYSVPHRFDVSLRGNASAPIFVEGASGERVVITRADDRENLMDIGNSRYCVISGLEFVGGSTGIRIRSSSQLMITNCVIHGVGNNGVSANSDDADSLFLVDNEIYDTNGNAEGFYLGSHDVKARVSNSIIAGNYIHDLGNSELNQGDGIEIKNRSFGNVIKWNFIARTKFPGVIAYSAGDAVGKPNVIEQNAIFDSLDCGIQVNSDAIVRNNFIFGGKFGIVSKPFEAEPHSLQIVQNTIFGEGCAVKASQWNSKDIVFANNALYSRAGEYYYAGVGMAVCSKNRYFTKLESNFDYGQMESFKRSPVPSASGDFKGKADTRYSTPVDFFDEIRTEDPDIGAFSSLRHGENMRQKGGGRPRFRLQGIDAGSAEASMYDQESGTNPVHRWLIVLPERLRHEPIESWWLVLRESPTVDRLEVWAKGGLRNVFYASLDPSARLDSPEEIPLNLVVSFSEAIAFATCNTFGEPVLASPMGLLVVPK